MVRSTETAGVGLDHVVVAGGTPAEWLKMSVDQWRARLEALAAGAEAGGAHWVTLLPHHGTDLDDVQIRQFNDLLSATGKVVDAELPGTSRWTWHTDSGLTVIVDPMADGHRRFAHAVEALRQAGVEPASVDIDTLSRVVLQPADAEVDLVVILGPPDTIPDSMVWELAYSELVFLDIGWSDLVANHLELAIDDFNRRHRRFGGLDS